VLVLDGCFEYYSRRQAQYAADAGALAGVMKLCDASDDVDMGVHWFWLTR
jgi:hypothetical protein